LGDLVTSIRSIFPVVPRRGTRHLKLTVPSRRADGTAIDAHQSAVGWHPTDRSILRDIRTVVHIDSWNVLQELARVSVAGNVTKFLERDHVLNDAGHALLSNGGGLGAQDEISKKGQAETIVISLL